MMGFGKRCGCGKKADGQRMNGIWYCSACSRMMAGIGGDSQGRQGRSRARKGQGRGGVPIRGL